ncbi:uncharacterized protein [Asterias amurensis]|uniref:uncharacterized protein n=1 Tax=Asterias amurensis TaxID=7602 RepID=UPI003AB58CD5
MKYHNWRLHGYDYGYDYGYVYAAVASGRFNIPCQNGTRTDQIRKGTQHTFYHGPIRDHALRGKVYRSATARSKVTCAVFCLQEDACKSFNYCEDAEVCELNYAVFTRDKSDLQPSNGWMYFDEEYHGIISFVFSSTECPVDVVSGNEAFNYIYPRLLSSDVFRLDFSVKGTNDAHLSLSEFTDETSYYLVVIGGWINTRSVVQCERRCQTSPYAEKSTPGIMSELEYRRFWLTYDHGTIKVGKGGEVTPFLEWHDETRRVTVNYIGITSYYNRVNWIFYTFCTD